MSLLTQLSFRKQEHKVSPVRNKFEIGIRPVLAARLGDMLPQLLGQGMHLEKFPHSVLFKVNVNFDPGIAVDSLKCLFFI